MDKIQKFVRKLSAGEARRVFDALEQVLTGRLSALSVKKLKGDRDIYRVRVGRVRIIFTKVHDQNIITDVDFRNDNTY